MSKPQPRLLAAPATAGMGEIVRKPHQEGEFTRECIGVRACVYAFVLMQLKKQSSYLTSKVEIRGSL